MVEIEYPVEPYEGDKVVTLFDKYQLVQNILFELPDGVVEEDLERIFRSQEQESLGLDLQEAKEAINDVFIQHYALKVIEFEGTLTDLN